LKGKNLKYYGGCDPSMGKNNPSAIVTGCWDTENEKLYLVEAEIKHRSASQLETDLINLQLKYNMLGIAFENNNAYEYMRADLMEKASQKGVILPLIPITSKIPLEVRIEAMEPFICSLEPKILFHSGLSQLLSELETWPEKQSHHHYDGLSALGLLFEMIIKRHAHLPRLKTSNQRQWSYTDAY
jgi:predicted phage terminase large subunit-like protein